MDFILPPYGETPEPPSIDDADDAPKSFSAGKNSAGEQGTTVPMAWKPTPAEPVPVVRCTARSKTSGEQCRKWSLRGATVCTSHGAQLPNVKEHAAAVVESARMRLMGMSENAVDVLEELMRPGTAEAIRLKAAENILNRAGIRDAIDVNVGVTHTMNMAEEVTKKLDVMRERLRPAEPEEDDDTIDAEVVDSEEQN